MHSRVALSVHRVKTGIRDVFAKEIVANMVLEARHPEVRENSQYTFAGTHLPIRTFFGILT